MALGRVGAARAAGPGRDGPQVASGWLVTAGSRAQASQALVDDGGAGTATAPQAWAGVSRVGHPRAGAPRIVAA